MPTKHLDYFRSLVADDAHFPLTEAAIAVAQHAYPALDVQSVLDEIDALVIKRCPQAFSNLGAIKRLKDLLFFGIV